MLVVKVLGLLSGLCSSSKLDGFPASRRKELYEYMDIAAAAYGSSDPVERHGLANENIPVSLQVLGFRDTVKEIRLFTDSSVKERIFAIPGTACAKDWVNNFTGCFGHAPFMGKHNVWVHIGMYNESLEIYEALRPALLKSAQDGYQLTFVGHSRAGPNCQFVMSFFGHEFPQYKSMCYLYAFNSALGGGPEFASAFNAYFPGQAFNVFDPSDIVHYAGIPGSVIPGVGYEVSGHGQVDGTPHKIGVLMSNFQILYMPEIDSSDPLIDPEYHGMSCPDEALAKIFSQMPDLAFGENAKFIVIFPGKTIDDNMKVEQSETSSVLVNLDGSQRAALISSGLNLLENGFILAIDRNLKDKKALKYALKRAIQAGAKTYVTHSVHDMITARLDYSGMALRDVVDFDKALDGTINVAVVALMHLKVGDKKGAAEAVKWGAASVASSYGLSQSFGREIGISFGPCRDSCNLGLFRNLNHLEIDSKFSVDVAVPNVPGLTVGVSLLTDISFGFSASVHGVQLNYELKATCPIGAQAKYFGIIKIAVYLGNARVDASGKKELPNGDIKYIGYKRRIEGGAIFHTRVANRGNVWSLAVIRDVETKHWDVFFQQPRGKQSFVPLRHLISSENFTELGDREHLNVFYELSEMLGLSETGRIQETFGEGGKSKKERKGLNIYRSGKKEWFDYESFIESSNTDITQIKNPDGSFTTSFLRHTCSGQDTIKTEKSGGRRILMIRYDKGSKKVCKVVDTKFFSKNLDSISITTFPDGSFQMTTAPKGYKDSEHKFEKAQYAPWKSRSGKWTLETFYRDHDKSELQFIRQYTDQESGKIVNERVTPEKTLQVKMLACATGQGKHWDSYFKGEKALDEGTFIVDLVSTKWNKHLPEYKAIETFVQPIVERVYTLFACIESFEGLVDNLNHINDFANYRSAGTYSVDLGATTKLEVTKDGMIVFKHKGIDVQMTKFSSSSETGQYESVGMLNEKGNVQPVGTPIFTSEYQVDNVTFVLTGPKSAPLLIDVHPTLIPQWLGGATGAKGNTEVLATVESFLQENDQFIPIAPNVEPRQDSAIAQVVQLIKELDVVVPSGPTKGTEAGLEYSEKNLYYKQFYRVWLQSKDDVLNGDTQGFSIIKTEDLGILSEHIKSFHAAGKKYVAQEELDEGQKLSENFCKPLQLTPSSRAFVEALLVGYSVIEANFDEKVTKMSAGSAIIEFDTFINGLTGITTLDPVTTKLKIEDIELESKVYETTATTLNFHQHIDTMENDTIKQGESTRMKFKDLLITGKKGGLIIVASQPSLVPARLGGDSLNEDIKNDKMANPSVTVTHFHVEEVECDGVLQKRAAKLFMVLEDIRKPSPTPSKFLDIERGREGTITRTEYDSSETLEFDADKRLSDVDCKFKMSKRTDTGKLSQTDTVFNKPGENYLQFVFVKGEAISEGFGVLADIKPKNLSKIKKDLMDCGMVELQAFLLHRDTEFKDQHMTHEEFAGISGRKNIDRKEPVKIDIQIEGFNLEQTSTESKGRGFEYSQITDANGDDIFSDQEDLGNIINKRMIISGHVGSAILIEDSPKNIIDGFGGRVIEKYLKARPIAKGFKTRISIQAYTKDESVNENDPTKDTTNRRLVVSVDGLQSGAGLAAVNLLKGRCSTSIKTIYDSSTNLVLQTSQDLGHLNAEFTIKEAIENDVAEVTDVQYFGINGNLHLDSQIIGQGSSLRVDFAENAEFLDKNREILSKDIGRSFGEARVQAILRKSSIKCKDGTIKHQSTVVVSVLKNVVQTKVDLETGLFGLMNKTLQETTGHGREYIQVQTGKSTAILEEGESSLFSSLLNSAGIYAGGKRLKVSTGDTFETKDLGLITDQITTEPGFLSDTITTQRLVNGEAPIDPRTGKQIEANQTQMLSSSGSAMAGSVIGACVELYQRTKTDCPANMKLDTREKFVEFFAKKGLTTVVRGAQAILSNSPSVPIVCAKVVLHCLSKRCLDEMGPGNELTGWEMMECTGSALGEIALRSTGGFTAMAVAAHAVNPIVKGCKLLKWTLCKDGQCIVGTACCTRDKRTCPAGEKCPWDCSADLVSDSLVNCAVGVTSTMALYSIGAFIGSFALGPIGTALCGVSLSALVAPAVTKKTNEAIRSRSNPILKSVSQLERERAEALQFYRKHSIAEGLDRLSKKPYCVTITMADLLASKDPHMIWQRSRHVFIRLHPDKRIAEVNDYLDEVVKNSKDYRDGCQTLKRELLATEKGKLLARQNAEVQEFNQLLVDLNKLVEQYFGLESEPKPSFEPGSLETTDKAKVKQINFYRRTASYLCDLFSHACKICTSTMPSIVLYRVLSADYYAARLEEKYNLHGGSSLLMLIDTFNKENLNGFRANVYADFSFYLEAKHHIDSFGLHTLEYAVLLAMQASSSIKVHTPLNPDAIIESWWNQRMVTIADSDINPFPYEQAENPLSVSSYHGNDPKIVEWLFTDLLLLSPIPSENVGSSLALYKSALEKKETGCLEKLENPLKFTDFMGTANLPRKVFESEKDSLKPGLTMFSSYYGEIPLTILDGTHKLFGYVQGIVAGKEDIRQWAQAPSLTLNAGSGYIRLDGRSAFRAGTRAGDTTVNVASLQYALYLPIDSL